MKIRSLTNLLMALTGLLIGLFSLITYFGLNSLNKEMSSSIKEAIWFENTVNNTRQAQVDFQRQVQEWKNILIRGNDLEMYNKYLKGFEEKENAVQTRLIAVKKDLLGHEYQTEAREIDVLLLEHKKLGETYREALKTFNKEDAETGKKVDLLLRGIDRPASKAMDSIAERLQSVSEKELHNIQSNAEKSAYNNLIYLAIISIVTLVAFITTSLYIARVILKKLGAEPNDLAVIFNAMAKGDLTQRIDIDEKDEESMAASAQVMQLKLRSIIVSIQKGADEVSNIVDNVSSDLPNHEIMEKLRETKHTVRGLERTVERFKVK